MSCNLERTRWAALAAAAITVVACGGAAPGPGADVALLLDGEPVPYRRFERYLARNVGTGEVVDMPSDAVLSQLFDRFVDEELLVRMAVGAGFDAERVEAEGHRPPIAFLLERALDREPISDKQVEAYFDDHRDDFRQPEMVHLWQILVTRRRLAEEARSAIAGGESFPSVARRLASDPDANFCGDQGLLAQDDLPRSLAGPIFALEAGETSDVLKTDSGFYLFWAQAKVPASARGLEEITSDIREILRRSRLDAIEEALIEESRARYAVQVFAANLPFEYQGSYADNG